MNTFFTVLDRVNVPKIVTIHLVGDNHSPLHHRVVGGIIAIFGFLLGEGEIIQTGYHLVNNAVGFIGFSLHAVGAVPYVAGLEKKMKQSTQTSRNEPENKPSSEHIPELQDVSNPN